MKFSHVEMLFFIWSVPLMLLVYILGMRKRRRVLDRFSTRKALAHIAPGAGGRQRWIKAFLMLGVLLFTSVALSGPRYGYKWKEIERKGIDIVIALDCSRSMLANDVHPTRLDRAKREIIDLLNLLQGDRVGLTAFAGTAFLQCPLTLDYEAFNLFLNSLTPDFLPVGGTDLSMAVETARSAFNPEDRSDKAVILITDGERTGPDPTAAAEKLKKDRIKLFCIGVGKSDGVPIPDPSGGFRKDASGNIIMTRLDETTLKSISTLTGGTYVRSVAGDMDLDVIYTKRIRGDMEASTLSSGKKQVWEDRYQWALVLALVLFIIEMFVSSANKSAAVLLVVLCLLSFHIPNAQAESFNSCVQEGQKAFDANEYENALKHFIGAQLKAPERADVNYNIANTYYRLEDFETAQHHYQQAIDSSEDPKLKQKAFYNLGNSRYRMGRLKDAAASYEKALELDPDDSQARANLEYVKKVMKQQKKQALSASANGENNPDPSEAGKDKNNPDSTSNPSDKTSEQASSEPDGQKKSDKNDVPTYGDRMENDPDREHPETSAGTRNDSEKSENENSPTPGRGGNTSNSDTDKKDADQARRLLNRLKDEPGRAMMPIYQKQRVEKDW